MVDDHGALKEATAEAVLRGPGDDAGGAAPGGGARRAARGSAGARREDPPPRLPGDRRGPGGAPRDRYTEDQIFELVVAAAFGAADERLRAGLRALEEA